MAMDLLVKSGGIQAEETDAIVVNLFEGVTEPGGATGAVDKALDGAIRDLIAGGDLRGKLNETAIFYPRGAIPPGGSSSSGWGQKRSLVWTAFARLLPWRLAKRVMRGPAGWPRSSTAAGEGAWRWGMLPRQ
jgi:hypothetical protein